jgi:hypothetical protein
MSPSDDRLRALTTSVEDRVRATLAGELIGLVASVQAIVAEEQARAAEDARHAAEHARRAVDDARRAAEVAASALVSEAIAAERTTAAERLARDVDEARATAQARERQAELVQSERLLGAVRALDAASSLTDVLDRLVNAARDEAGRAALLVVRGASLRGWTHAGFPDGTPSAADLHVPASDAGLLSAAIAARDVRTTTEASHDVASGSVPAPFTLSSDDRVGIAVPVLVDGHAVAVLYADDDGELPRTVPSAWPERVELLTRHASRCLEGVTARHTGAGNASGQTAEARADSAKVDDEAAQRFARLLVSEIKLYHEPIVDEGRRARDLRHRLHAEIERARKLYEERVPPGVRDHTDYFEQELVRTLAGGDPVLLGRDS